MITAERYHDFSAGHRVVGHEGKCRFLHGHNYRVHFVCVPDFYSQAGLDEVGRVIDFGEIKAKLCMWLENNWDHKFLAWKDDTLLAAIEATTDLASAEDDCNLVNSIVWLPFNPTAENMAKYLVETIAPVELFGTGAELIECRIEETRKCSCTYKKEQ